MQYCVEREDRKKTWEDERILEKSPDVKDLIADYMRALDYRKNAPLKKLRKLRARKKDSKGHQKGSFERGNRPTRVLGLKRSKVNGQRDGPVIVKLQWEPEIIKRQSDASMGGLSPSQAQTLFQPEPSYAPHWRVKLEKPELLIKFYEEAWGYNPDKN